MQVEVNSPFKLLDPYDKSDRGIFFGREKEISALYDIVNKNRIVLVYGKSGTGKTSIIKCGLANEFDVTDWIPFYIRRGENINLALQDAIENVMVEPARKAGSVHVDFELFSGFYSITPESVLKELVYTDDDKAFITRFVYSLQHITEYYLRPVYLIFDQFEELLILGDQTEKDRFIKTLKILLSPDSMVDCHIIIVMREEYFGLLDSFEKDIVVISDRRLRVEIMRENTLTSVIRNTCEKFNIGFEDPDKNIHQIITNLESNGEVELPYLQVYLDLLWRTVYDKQYPHGAKPGKGHVPLTFTTEDIQRFGEIKDVMLRFLMERRQVIQQHMYAQFPEAPENCIAVLLDWFASDQGTKVPHAYRVVNGNYRFEENLRDSYLKKNPECLQFALEELQKNQILRNTGNAFELGHDILAKLIDRQRDARQKKLNGIKVMIKLHKKNNELIPYDSIRNWEKYIDQLELTDKDRAFFKKSQAVGQKREYEVMLKKERQNRRTRLFKSLTWSASIGILILSFLIYGGFRQLNSYYAVDYLSNLDTIRSRIDALRLARYIYDFKNYAPKDRGRIEKKIVSLASNQDIQASYASFVDTLNTATGLIPGFDIDMSTDGKYMLCRNDPTDLQGGPGLFQALRLGSDRSIVSVRTFPNSYYGYFLDHTNQAIFAQIDSARVGLTLGATRFVLYDFEKDKADTFVLSSKTSENNFLYTRDFIQRNEWSVHHSYRIQMTDAGMLVVPIRSWDASGSFLGAVLRENVLFYIPGRKRPTKLNSIFPVGISPDGKRVTISDTLGGRAIVRVYNEKGRYLFRRNGNFFSHFAAGDRLALSNNRMLVFQDENGKAVGKMSDDNHGYVIAADRNGRTLVTDVDTTELRFGNYVENNAPMLKLQENLKGFNATSNYLVSKPATAGNDSKSDTLIIKRDLAGQSLGRFMTPLGISGVQYSHGSDYCLVLTGKDANTGYFYLYLLNDSLAIQASFNLTPNDSYGFSRDGQFFYFVRDTRLNVFNTAQTHINFSDYHSIEDWMIKNDAVFNFKDESFSDIKKTNRLKFPSQVFGN